MTEVANAAPTETVQAQAPEAPKTEGQPAPAAAAPETPKESASAILAKLAKERKERAGLTKKLSAADTEKAQLEARLKELEGKVTAKPKTPLEALQAAGFSYKDATDFILNNSELTPQQMIKTVQEEIASLRSAQEEKERKAQEDAKSRAQADVDQAIATFKDEISDFVEVNKEKYELTALYSGQELIYETIAQHYSNEVKAWEEAGRQGKPPKIMSKDEAAELVEKYFEEELDKVQKTKKFMTKFGAAKAEADAKPGSAPAKTLSNAVTASSSGSTRINDPIKRAMAALDKLGT